MNTDWAEMLAETLQNERDILGRLSDISEQKTDVIAEGDVSRLDGMLSEEQPLIMQLEYMEAERSAVLRQADMEGKTLTEVARKAQDNNRARLLSLLDSFHNVLVKIKTANDINTKLIRSKLEFYDILRGMDRQAGLYAAGGKVKESAEAKGYIDKKA